MEYAIRMPWKVTIIYILVLFGSFSTGLHLGNVSRKKNVKQLTNQFTEAGSHVHSGSKKAVENVSATNKASDLSLQSTRKLQLEIQELQRMQKQLKSEMVSGADNSKKTKLLQHIKTQIQLRRMQQTRGENHKRPILSKQSGLISDKRQVNLPQQQLHTAKKLIVAQRTKSNLQTHQKVSTKQKKTHNIQNVQESQYQKQQKQIQQLKQQKQELKQRSQYTVQSKIKSIVPEQKSHRQTYVNHPAGKNVQMQFANSDLMYNGLDMQNQQLPQMQALSPTAFIQQRLPVQLNNQVGMNQAQINFVDQQVTGMRQGGVQLDSAQHVLVPLNALAVNNLVPKNVLSGERFIVLDTALQDNMQLAMAGGSLLVQAEKKKSTLKPTTPKPPTTKASTQAQQITKPTTQRPSTTVATKPPTTHSPTPPTTERVEYDSDPANNGLFKQQFYSGELQRQQLEITKLKLEIRALRRKEIAEMQMRRNGDSENEDAPPRRRNMMRLRQKGMPFQFF